jgi:uroporphyrin-III C-methyltransferase/precorrin-2 dehydrogenase/sirohydrochlorin ferrochelatase
VDFFPVFLNLRGRAVLVVGGGEVASRKIAVLLQAGADVTVVAPLLHQELLAAHEQQRIRWINGRFSDHLLDSQCFAVAATDDHELNLAVTRAGTARNIFVNAVDDSVASTCIMPAIVDRSPLIIAVSSGGNTPTLARRVRAQLEALLPQSLGLLAATAGRWRERVQQALPDLSARRRYWDAWFDGAAATGATVSAAAIDAQLEQALAVARTAQPRGAVWLIGAGPGDADLLTLRALQLLQQCDVVLYDRLVGEAVLNCVRRDAERVYVGKQTGQHRTTQARINELLVDYARRGLRVARLKGGDPLVFGRGGEELAALAAAGIPVVIVPGVTAALGAAALAGIPLTHRGVSQSVSFVTAMAEATELLDWQVLAAPLQTIVFYMGVAQLARIVERLRAHGAPASCGAAVVERATLPGQRVIVGQLDSIVAQAEGAAVRAPALLIVGDVVKLRTA